MEALLFGGVTIPCKEFREKYGKLQTPDENGKSKLEAMFEVKPLSYCRTHWRSLQLIYGPHVQLDMGTSTHLAMFENNLLIKGSIPESLLIFY